MIQVHCSDPICDIDSILELIYLVTSCLQKVKSLENTIHRNFPTMPYFLMICILFKIIKSYLPIFYFVSSDCDYQFVDTMPC